MTTLLSVAEMYRADRAALAQGIDGLSLMENAGAGVAREILGHFGARNITILCGPGNNGGDGFVAARHLRRGGAKVRVALLGQKARLKGDAAVMAKRWRGKVLPLAPEALEGAELVVDALFGAGLSRPVTGPARAVLEAAAAAGLPSVAVDCPSGVEGDSGQVLGHALPAAMTVSFFRAKACHYLQPGRGLSGELRLIDIGIEEAVLRDIAPATWLNGPDLWFDSFPWAPEAGHKYDRGHAVVLSGPRGRSGAARLAARAALRVGAGLVTVASPVSAMAENAARLTAVMVRECRDGKAFGRLIADPRVAAVLLGPGGGVHKATREAVLATLKAGKTTLLDADALSVFEPAPERLFKAIKSDCILTPHEGEFRRLFETTDGKLERARAAALAAALKRLERARRGIDLPADELHAELLECLGQAVRVVDRQHELRLEGSHRVLNLFHREPRVVQREDAVAPLPQLGRDVVDEERARAE